METVTGADGLIAVTPIFSASYSGLFKTFFDVLEKDALSGKPVLLGATAGKALLGSSFRVRDNRGRPIDSPLAPLVTATVHPSSIRAGFQLVSFFVC